MPNYLTALDVGSSNIKAIVAEEKKDGRLSVVGVIKQPSAGFRKGKLVDIDEAVDALRQVFADLRSISKRATENIYLNVNGSNIKSHLSRGVAAVARVDNEIRQDDIHRALQSSQALNLPPNHLILHNVTREFFIDDIGDIIDPLGMSGSRLEVSSLIISAFSPLVDGLVRCVEKAGGSVGALIFNPLAASRSVLTKHQKNLGTALIDIGFGTTTLAVYEENKVLHAASFPVGSGHITNDLAIGLKTSTAIAEEVKLRYGFALAKNISKRDMVGVQELDDSIDKEISKKFLSEIIEVRLAEILELVNDELKLINRDARLPAGIVVTGGGAKLAGLIELAKQELELAIQVGVPDTNAFEIDNANYKEMLLDPEFGVATGLLLWATEGGSKPAQSAKMFGGMVKFLKNLKP